MNRRITVLSIDDDPADLALLERYFGEILEWTVNFITATTGEEGLAKLASRPEIDIAFMDYHLGRKTGLEVLKEIRASGDERPVVVFTGSSDPRLAAELVREGADDYMMKDGVSPDVLRRIVVGVLDRYQLRQEKAVLAAQLNQSQKMEAVGTLAGGIAHDFNNMLTGIMGFLELAIMKSKGRDVERDLRHVQASCETMAELIHRLLAFSSHQGFTDEIVSLRAVLTELEVILSHTIPKDISVHVELPEENIVVRGNGAQIHQVFLNLCINAAQAMPEGGNLSVKVEKLTADKNYLLTHDALAEGEYYITQVSDTGAGMSKRTLERIFEPFFTTKNLSSKKGTGLGLAVTWQIVKEHGGHIDVYSEPGEGSIFRVFLPISTESFTGAKKSESIELPGGGETILLVDDEAIVLSVAAELLEQLGYKIRSAEDGITAEEIFRQYHDEIDLVILDLSMPRMGGRECLKRLREINPNIPAIFSSGHNMEAARESLLAEGAQEVIQKPYRMEELARKIRAVVEMMPA